MASSPTSAPPNTADLEPRKACHQCRQMKALERVACCKNPNLPRKPCRVTFCDKCLLNRYGEKIEEVKNVAAWLCPKCRGVCNCSVCMKRKGQQPTGALTPKAKATGFVSVLELLQRHGHRTLEKENKGENVAAAPAEDRSVRVENLDGKMPDEGSTFRSNILNGISGAPLVANDSKVEKYLGMKEVWSSRNSMRVDGKNNANFGSKNDLSSSRKGDKNGSLLSSQNHVDQNHVKRKLDDSCKGKEDVCASMFAEDMSDPSPKVIKMTKRVTGDKHVAQMTPVPQGTRLTTVAGIELSAEDVGPALQFLEFCAAFENVLNVYKGQPEQILRELLRGRAARWAMKNSLVAQFHIRILSLLNKSVGVRSHNNNGKSWLQELKGCLEGTKISMDLFDDNISGYDSLEPSKKLRILNFLCDEILGTNQIRSLIDDERAKFVERKKEEREKQILEKEKQPLSDQLDAQVQNRGLKAPLFKKRLRSDAVRTDPVSSDVSGNVFWKVKGYCNSSRIALQDINNLEMGRSDDKWFVYDDDEEKIIEKHIASLKNWRLKNHRESIRHALMGE